MMSWREDTAIALIASLTFVGFLMGAPRWLAVLYAALGIAMAVDSVRLARPRRGRERGRASETLVIGSHAGQSRGERCRGSPAGKCARRLEGWWPARASLRAPR